MAKLIPRNNVIPTKKSQIFTTYKDQESVVSIKVYKGFLKHLIYPESLQLQDANGILNVKAEDKVVGKSEKITITNEKGRLSQEEVERMVREAKHFAEKDKKVKEKIEARNALETYVYNMKNQVSDKDKLSSSQMKRRESKARQKKHLNGLMIISQKEVYDEKLKEVEAVCNPIQRSSG
ncbi:LOW QUALITY PROTEIN: hypothetical protein M8C21_032529 [Ambrosia artemisiifolia]|uniref:Uncharacterized protein n=1 Tax=Ambrosia artemisiifolia TaxID=4212 RepID=A0AAD5DA00_AMBAR|nr:LOW QUALITY PROTEIN: hypothetical protein M8C21_032529 [Ambrosia artemisiifolia]